VGDRVGRANGGGGGVPFTSDINETDETVRAVSNGEITVSDIV